MSYGNPPPMQPTTAYPLPGVAGQVLPYASPHGYTDSAWREGNVLIVRKDTVLPDRCFKCNAPAEGQPLKKRLAWHHPALFLLIVFPGLLIYAIVALIVQKKGTVYIGLCGAHRRRRVFLISIAWALVLGSIVLFVLSGQYELGVLALAGIIMFLAGLIMAVAIQLTTAKRIDDHFVWLRGAGSAFLDNFPAVVR